MDSENPASANLWKGMHYPATDIPTQARRLYIINRVRLLQDIEADTARLVSLSPPAGPCLV